MSQHLDPHIIIVGCGIIGLYVAYQLAQDGHGRDILVVAEHMPGDTSINYTSPWAGADFSAVSGSDANAMRWDRTSYPLLLQMADDAEQPWVQRTRFLGYRDERPADKKIEEMAEYLEDFRVLDAHELIEGTSYGFTFTTVTMNAPAQCRHLQRLLTEQHGVRFLRKRLPRLLAAFDISPSAKMIFNCIGGAAETLPDVTDGKCYPTRGQIVLAHAPNVKTAISRGGDGYSTYIIPRPKSGGQVVLGGYQQKGVRTGDTFAEETDSILERTRELLPALRDDDIHPIVALAGLRPSREGGARIEREELGDGRIVVHNYGAGGSGYQAGLGMAIDAIALANPELAQQRGQSHL